MSAVVQTLLAIFVGGLLGMDSALPVGEPDRAGLLTDCPDEVQTVIGSIAGCATDRAGEALPGVTITADRRGTVRQVVTDAKGCYELPNLEAGDYLVEAKLAGFKTMTRSVVVGSGKTTRVDLSLCVGGLMDDVWVLPRSYEHLVRAAEAVVHVRISGTRLEPDCENFWIHTAQVLHVVKPTAGLSHSIELSQFKSGTEPTPYPVGTELVMGISVNPSARFERTAGPFGVYYVNKGRVTRARQWGTTRYDNMRLTDFLGVLQELVRS